jgi:transposase
MFSSFSVFLISKVEAALYGQWATEGEVFTKFFEQSLRPMLNPNHVVVMDNVSFHKVQRVNQIIQQAGARLIYLPPYHPELNPIEEMWSKIKNRLRHLSARTLPTFPLAIKNAFQAVTQSDLMGWFKHAGYYHYFRKVL